VGKEVKEGGEAFWKNCGTLVFYESPVFIG
jgi:hypothetical protein